MGFFSRGVVWKPVKGYEGSYEVSNEGIVKSLKRKDSIGRQLQEKELTRSVNNVTGYYQVDLSKNGVKTTKQVHQLVAEAFCKKPKTKEKIEVHHKDHNPKNNKASNLKWELVSVHRSKHKQGNTNSQGEKHGGSILTEAHAIEILEDLENPYWGQVNDLARKYGVTPATISYIKKGKTWKHLKRKKK